MTNFYDATLDLMRLTNIVRPTVRQVLEDRVEKIVRDVLDNPKANETQLLLVPTLLSQLPNVDKGEHLDIFARILLDVRIADPWQLFDPLLTSELDLTPLRSGLSKRYLNAASDDSKAWYINKLASLPDGTFNEPSDDEQAILNEAVRLLGTASPIVERMADQGTQVIPELLSLMEASRDLGGRRILWEGIRNAFKRLGREGAPAFPKILAMIERSPGHFFDLHEDKIEWLVTLRLLGVEESELQRILGRQSTENVDGIMEIVNKEFQKHL